MDNPFPYTNKMYNCYRIFIACQQITKEREEGDSWISSVEVKQKLPLTYTVILRDLKTLVSLGMMQHRIIKGKRTNDPKNFFKIVKDESAFLELKIK